MTHDQLDFVTYCIGNVAEFLHLDQQTVYRMLKTSGILTEYIIPGYDVLHTFSGQYITTEIVDYMREKGIIK